MSRSAQLDWSKKCKRLYKTFANPDIYYGTIGKKSQKRSECLANQIMPLAGSCALDGVACGCRMPRVCYRKSVSNQDSELRAVRLRCDYWRCHYTWRGHGRLQKPFSAAMGYTLLDSFKPHPLVNLFFCINKLTFAECPNFHSFVTPPHTARLQTVSTSTHNNGFC